MFVAKVTGSLVSTHKVDSMVGAQSSWLWNLIGWTPKRARVSSPQDEPSSPSTTWEPAKATTCLLTQGSSARLTPETKSYADRRGGHWHHR